jgi:hypothetical protein
MPLTLLFMNVNFPATAYVAVLLSLAAIGYWAARGTKRPGRRSR